MYVARRIGSGLGKPGPDFFDRVKKQSEIARYVTEFHDDYRFDAELSRSLGLIRDEGSFRTPDDQLAHP
jgi:hypothetical protein